MDTLNEEFRTFIDERINDNFSKLSKTKEFSELNNKYINLLEKMRNTLSDEQIKRFESLLELNNSLHSQEIFFCYHLGLIDGIKIENSINL